MRRRIGQYESWWVAGLALIVCIAANYWRNHSGWAPSHFELGGEYFWIASALLDGRGYANAFGPDTGPTGWMPPAYTLLLAAIKAVTGGAPGQISPSFLPVLVGLKCLCLAWGAGLAASILRQLHCPRATRWALLPAWLLLAVWAYWINLTMQAHDTWWLTWVLALGIHGIVSIPRSRHHFSLISGLVLAALSSPVLFIALLITLGWRCVSFPSRWRWLRGIRPVLPAISAGLITLGGWSVFIHANTGIWAPGKTNGGFELWQSLFRTGDGIVSASTAICHPVNDPTMKAQYMRLGERDFISHYSKIGMEQLTLHPDRYVAQVLNRAFNALVWMQNNADSVWLNSQNAQTQTILDELCGKALVAPVKPGASSARREMLFMRMNDAELDQFAPDLSLPAITLWKTIRDRYQEQSIEAKELGKYQPNALAQSGLVSLSWLLAWMWSPRRLRRRLMLLMICYLIVLAPYILISHYSRYQGILLVLQVIALAVAAGAFWGKAKTAFTRA